MGHDTGLLYEELKSFVIYYFLVNAFATNAVKFFQLKTALT